MKKRPQRFLTLWLLGTEAQPASPEEVRVFKKFVKTARKSCRSIVWNHAVRWLRVPRVVSPVTIPIFALGTEERPATVQEITAFTKLYARCCKHPSEPFVWAGHVVFIEADKN